MLVPSTVSPRRTSMRAALTVVVVLAAFVVAIHGASGAGVPDLLKSSTRRAALKPGVVYQASLFAPHVRITAPEPDWQGAQWVDHSYDWFNVSRENGGILAVSAPSTTQSAAATLHLLETERADSRAVGITIRPAVPVTVGGYRGQQFDGVATGQYGHTFVPFSGHSNAASSSVGDHRKFEHGKAFRVIVLDVRGKPVVFFIDSDAPTLDLNFQA